MLLERNLDVGAALVPHDIQLRQIPETGHSLAIACASFSGQLLEDLLLRRVLFSNLAFMPDPALTGRKHDRLVVVEGRTAGQDREGNAIPVTGPVIPTIEALRKSDSFETQGIATVRNVCSTRVDLE